MAFLSRPDRGRSPLVAGSRPPRPGLSRVPEKQITRRSGPVQKAPGEQPGRRSRPPAVCSASASLARRSCYWCDHFREATKMILCLAGLVFPGTPSGSRHGKGKKGWAGPGHDPGSACAHLPHHRGGRTRTALLEVGDSIDTPSPGREGLTGTPGPRCAPGRTTSPGL